MGLYRKRFGSEKLAITEKDEKLIFEQLRKVDENRLELFAYISLVAISVMLVLDFFFFNQKLKVVYLLFDSIFWVISALVISFTSLSRKRATKANILVKKYTIDLFPLSWLLWATAVCALDPTSLLNIITFYFMIFLFSFTLMTTFRTILLFYLIIAGEYIFLKILTDQPIMTENSMAMVIVCGLILPFYSSFHQTRVNSQAALLMLKDAKKNLEDEVAISSRELLILNSNLQDEIRQRKIVESKIRETLKLAESNNQLKSEFLANISHEIRTPLNAIIGFSEMLTEEGVTSERKKEFQLMIETNTGLLLSTIDDIFDASLVRTEQINPVLKPFAVNPFLQNLVYDLKSVALKYGNRNIAIKIHPHPDDLVILTDDFYLKKAILRLADNAYKFTEYGEIEVGVFEEFGQLIFYVSDTGVGIPEKDSIKIFEPFVQGDGSFTRDFGGSGLGLTIAKGISRSLGGILSYSSKVGVGSKFMISFSRNIIQR